jgi:hypothetical protein
VIVQVRRMLGFPTKKMRAEEFSKTVSIFRTLIVSAENGMKGGVISGKTRPFTTPAYRTEAEVRELVRLKDSNRSTYLPLAENQLDPSMAGFLAVVKPLLGKTAGAGSHNIQFLRLPR